MPLLARQEQKRKADGIVHANAPPQLSEPRCRRPYLLKMLQDGVGTRVLADTLDWDGELCVLFALTRSRAAALACSVRPVGNCGEKSEISFSFSSFSSSS
jgi:hypothetical protein